MNNGLINYSSRGNPDDNKNFYEGLGLETGVYYGASTLSISVLSNVPQRTYFTPFYIPQKQKFDRIGCRTGSAVPAGTVTIGLYTSGSSGRPSQLIISSSMAYSTSNTVLQTNIDISLQRGWYWFAYLNAASVSFSSYNTTVNIPYYCHVINTTAGFGNILYLDSQSTLSNIDRNASFLRANIAPHIFLRTSV